MEFSTAESQRCPSSSLTNDDSKSSGRASQRHRPGRFTYLKVDMDNDVMEALYGLACDVQRMLNNTAKLSLTDIASNSSIHNIKFQPRYRDSLHMTLFFGGEAICNLPARELVDWHRRVEHRLGKSGFSLAAVSLSESVSKEEDFSLDFAGLRVFPPHRKNLIVAEFEPSAAWRSLHKDLQDIALDATSYPTLAHISTRNPPCWIAHVTLGNLKGGNKESKSSLDSGLLHDLNNSTKSMAKHKPAKVVGISLGGPQPSQVSLDWNFRHSPTSS